MHKRRFAHKKGFKAFFPLFFATQTVSAIESALIFQSCRNRFFSQCRAGAKRHLLALSPAPAVVHGGSVPAFPRRPSKDQRPPFCPIMWGKLTKLVSKRWFGIRTLKRARGPLAQSLLPLAPPCSLGLKTGQRHNSRGLVGSLQGRWPPGLSCDGAVLGSPAHFNSSSWLNPSPIPVGVVSHPKREHLPFDGAL